MKTLFLSAVMLALFGCVSSSTHTEGDREVGDQTMKAGGVVVESIEQAKAKIEEGKPEEAKTLLEIGARAGRDVILNMKQQAQVHGSPKAPQPPYSAETSAKAREKSTKEHENNTLGVILGVGGVVLGIGATLAGMPWLANMFPALTGKVGKWAQTGSQILTAVRSKAESSGGSIDIRDVLDIAKTFNVNAGIQDFVKKKVDAHEEAMGHDFTMKLAPATAPEGAPQE